MVVASEKESIRPYMLQHLQDLMVDMELYGGEPVRAFHAIWLQQLKQGHATWADKEVKLKYQRALVWHHVAAPLTRHHPPFRSSARSKEKAEKYHPVPPAGKTWR